MRDTDALGRYGENVAVRTLTDAGMRVLERNWRCDEGEIDILAREGDVLVICEVKTRRGSACGEPAEAVTPVKLARLRRLAARWLAERVPAGGPAEVRFDVIAVAASDRGAASVHHLRGVS